MLGVILCLACGDSRIVWFVRMKPSYNDFQGTGKKNLLCGKTIWNYLDNFCISVFKGLKKQNFSNMKTSYA